MKQSEVEYLKGGRSAAAAGSTLLGSSSKYLNSARLRDVFAQEGLRKNGRDVPLAYLVPDAIEAFDQLKDLDLIRRLLADERQRKPDFAQWLDARFLSSIKVEQVAGCAPGTLGASVHEFMSSSGYAIDFMFLDEPKDDYEYLNKRLAQNHDIEHMVTGFGTDPAGESALMMCNANSWLRYFGPGLGGEMSRFNTYLTTMNLMKAGLHYAEVLATFYEAIRAGIEMGVSLERPLFLLRWEDYFDWPIAEIRSYLKLAGSPAVGAWNWTEAAFMERE
jgi:ubiquinone biosynthesis protein COQ4